MRKLQEGEPAQRLIGNAGDYREYFREIARRVRNADPSRWSANFPHAFDSDSGIVSYQVRWGDVDGRPGRTHSEVPSFCLSQQIGTNRIVKLEIDYLGPKGNWENMVTLAGEEVAGLYQDFAQPAVLSYLEAVLREKTDSPDDVAGKSFPDRLFDGPEPIA